MMHPRARGFRLAVCLSLALAVTGCTLGNQDKGGADDAVATKAAPPSPMPDGCVLPPDRDQIKGSMPDLGLVPAPAAVAKRDAELFTLTPQTAIEIAGPTSEFSAPADYLAQLLAPATGLTLAQRTSPTADTDVIRFCPLPEGKAEQYELYASKANGILVFAADKAAAFDAVATLRQLFPPQIESTKVVQAAWTVPAVGVHDRPRYHYRAMMLDVARSFFPPADVKKVIDTLALYKLNQLHLHLSDDQGWRVAIDGLPKLTEIGASYQAGHPQPGGPYFYTQDDYKDLVAYAASRGISIIPEFDGPSHVNAAQSAYGNLTCDGKATKPYTGHDVGFSLYCLESKDKIGEVTTFLTTVWKQVAAMTPGTYLHFGGDEAMKSTPTTFGRYVDIVETIAKDNDKTAMGWAQIGAGDVSKGTVLQYWGTELDNRTIGGAEGDHIKQLRSGLKQGAKVVMAPADRTYLDQCFDESTPIGTKWAGCHPPKDAYDWDPALYVSKGSKDSAVVPAKSILGVEACLFSDHLYQGWPSAGQAKDFVTPLEYFGSMSLPRLPALAEVAWTAQDARDWDDFSTRIDPHHKRWQTMGLDYYKD